MLGDTLTLPLDPTPRVLNKINQDQYSSEYLWVGTLSQIRVRIRHTKMAAKNGVPAQDRHNIEVVETVFATETAIARDIKVYAVFENVPGDDECIKLLAGMANYLIADTNEKALAMLGWQS